MEKRSLLDQASGEVCPDCGEEIRLGSGAASNEIRVDCPCGSALALV